jgi:hypothetical protein
VFRVERKRGRAWYAKYRLPDGRQVQRKIRPAWSQRSRPPAGYYTKRLAEDWLRGVIEQARRGTPPGMVRTGATFADAAAEFLRYVEHDRALKPSTLRGYRSIVDAYLLPAFGPRRLEDITARDVELWRSNLVSVGGDGRMRSQAQAKQADDDQPPPPRPLSNNSKNRIVTLLHGVFARACKAYGLPANPVEGIERHPVKLAGDIDVFSPEEVWAPALRRRYTKALADAALRPLRFHDLRHTFGTRMIAKADIRRVQEWMGHADIQTTMRYLHYAPRAEDAALVAEAFRVQPRETGLASGA